MNLLPLPRGWRLLALAVSFIVGASLALAQPSTGTVEGRVLNVATGRYLNNARVTVEGTSLQAFTNEFGEYRLNGVPAGQAKVSATFTGLDPQTATVSVPSGGNVRADLNLTSVERYGPGETVTLEAFKVAAQREFEGNALAINEQRYAPNVKVVMAADAFGDVTEGNVGEFLKYLPGITVDYVAADVRTVSVRGFADTFTTVSVDGMRTTSSVSGNSNRVFEFEQVSINNMARVEVTKVPTPEMPADSLGGSVNMISKNAFERKGAAFNYRLYLSANSEDLQLFKRSPGPGVDRTYKVLPGFDFDYTLPVNSKFGIVITGLTSNQFNEQHRWQPTWNYAQAGATPQNPYLQQWQLQDGPKNTYRDSGSVKLDYKLTPEQTISLTLQDNYYKSYFGNRNLNFNVGTNAASAVTGGTPLQWGQTFVQSATGTVSATTGLGNRATVTQGSSFRDKLGNTAAANLHYTYNGAIWNAEAGLNGAESRTWYRELARDHFSNVGTQLLNVAMVRADNIDFPHLTWVARDPAGNEINPRILSNYRLNTAQNSPVDGKATMQGAFANLDREFNIRDFPLGVKVGGATRREDRDNRRYQEQWNYVGQDGVANSPDDNAGPFLDPIYSPEDPYFGYPPIQWIDPYKLANVFRNNPGYFRGTTSTISVDGTNVTTAPGYPSELFRITNSQKISERVTAGFVQFSGKVLKSRLQFVTGVRYENTQDRGEGPLVDPDAAFQRNANGTFVRNAAGQRVLRPEAGAAGSLAFLRLTNVERGYKASRQYDGWYPSLHLTYNFSDNFLARFAYAKTLGRPDYTDIIPTATIDENETATQTPGATPGTIRVSNTALKPWSADNYDVSLEYYFSHSGVASIGVFQKDLKDFWSDVNTPLTSDLAQQIGVDPAYLGWTVVSTINGGQARISGAEFNFVRTLNFGFLPDWARNFSVSANGTSLHLQGPNGADFARFISKTGNLSLSWNRTPVSARVTFNYRGRQRNSAQTGAQYGATNNFFEYYDSRYNIDANLEYTFSRRIKLFANARNILNQPQVLERYNPASARYATGYRQEEFGVQYAAGVRGTF